jgi:hypothetical protein
MIAVRDPDERGQRFALRARAEDHLFVRRQLVELRRPHEHVVRNVHVAEVARDVDVLAHRAAHDADLPAHGDGDIDRLLHPVDVRSERRYEHTPLAQRHDLPECFPDDALRRRHPRPLRVRRVPEQEVDALVTEPREPSHVRFQPVDGRVVDLVVARVDDAARRRLEHDRDAIRDRVRHAHERDPKRAYLARRVVRMDLPKLRRAQQAVLVELRLHEPERQSGRPHFGHADLAQQVRQGADVVFVAVGQDDDADVRGAVSQIGEIREDEVDAEVLVARKGETRVDQHEIAAALDDGQVLTDLAEAAQRHDPTGFHAFSV